MNIFVLDTDPRQAAALHCDKHVVKMPLESAQMLSTAVRVHYSAHHPATIIAGSLYKSAYLNHPCTVWARETRANFLWLCDLAEALVDEHVLRFAPKRRHASEAVITCARAHAHLLPEGGLTPHAQAMPEGLRSSDPVRAYRRYYAEVKTGIAAWRPPRARPDWMPPA